MPFLGIRLFKEAVYIFQLKRELIYTIIYYIEQSQMTNSAKSEGVRRAVPFCQATGCFEHADVYVVLKETEEPAHYYEEFKRDREYEATPRPDPEFFDGFKLILYLCARHDNDFNYLVHGSELEIAKRCYLDKPAGLRRAQPSSR
jgi:hypothetical protein